MSYSNPEIQTLSSKIHLFSERNTSVSDYIDSSVREDELIYGIAKPLSNLLLHFPKPRKPKLEDFQSLINSYNMTNGTDLDIQYFIDRSYIRIISNHIVIPSVVSHTLWSIENEEKFEVPADYAHALNCLTQLRIKFNDQKPIIPETDAKTLLDSPKIELFVSKGILNRKGGTLEWKGREYLRHLRNEIISFIWITLLADDNYTSHRLRLMELCNIILQFDLWPDHLDRHLHPNKLKILKDEAYNLLLVEDDIQNNGQEFQKCWMDSPRYSHKNMFDAIPRIIITNDSPYAIIQQIEDLDSYFHLELAFGDARNLYDLLLRFIIQYDHVEQYSKLKSLLADKEKPHLAYNIYWNMKKNFPQIIPFLLTENDLASLAFVIITQLDIKREVVKANDPEEDSQPQQVYINQQKSKTELWCETFDLFIRLHFSNPQKVTEIVGALFQILIYQINQFYRDPTNYSQSRSRHFEARQRYEYAFKQIQNSRFSAIFSNIKPRIFPYLIQPIFQELLKGESISKYEQRTLDNSGFEMAIQLLRLTNTPVFSNEVPNSILQQNQEMPPKLARYLYDTLSNFFLAKEITVFDYHTGEHINKKPRWGGYPFAYDILDWGYCFGYLHMYGYFSKLIKAFEDQITFDKVGQGGKYEDQNNDTYTQLRLLLKALSYAVIQINKERTKLEILGLRIEETLADIYQIIEDYTLRYCVDDLENDRINALDDRYHFEANHLYYTNLTTIIFKALGYRDDEMNSSFVHSFVAENKNLALLLNISNSLDSVGLKRLLSDQIKGLSVDEFISSSSTTHEWKDAMIDAINSPYHFELSVPLAKRFEKHYQKVQHKNEQDQVLLYTVKLLHAFKTKDLKKLKSIDPPENRHALPKYNKPLFDKKAFFVGLHHLYNERDFDKAINAFENLISNNPKNVDYRYRMLHAKTLKAAKESNNTQIIASFDEWRNFVSEVKNTENESIKSLEFQIVLTSIYYYIATEEFTEVDRLLEKLPPEFLYDDEINQAVFDMYLKRDLNYKANFYLINGRKFYENSGQVVPETLQTLFDTIDNSETLDKLKQAFSEIYGLLPDEIIHTIPSKLNGQRSLADFIFYELIAAAKILMEKVRAITDQTDENKINDFFQSILRLRLAVWGWTIPDQGRVGKPNTKGKGLGSSDFLIESSGNYIGLVEALILKGKNKTVVEEHVSKCNSYLTHTRNIYMVTYYRNTNLNKDWKSYMADVLSTEFMDGFKLIENDFMDLSATLTSSRNIKIGKTFHQDGIVTHHLFFLLNP